MHASPTRHTPRFQYTFASDAELRAGVKLWFDDNAAAKKLLASKTNSVFGKKPDDTADQSFSVA